MDVPLPEVLLHALSMAILASSLASSPVFIPPLQDPHGPWRKDRTEGRGTGTQGPIGASRGPLTSIDLGYTAPEIMVT